MGHEELGPGEGGYWGFGGTYMHRLPSGSTLENRNQETSGS